VAIGLYLKLAVMPGVRGRERLRYLRWVARIALQRRGSSAAAVPAPAATESWAVSAREWLAPQLLPEPTQARRSS
jgi:hypothetical protein